MTLLIFLKPLITSRQHKVTLGVSRKLCQIRMVQVHYENLCALHLGIIKLAKIFLEPWSDLKIVGINVCLEALTSKGSIFSYKAVVLFVEVLLCILY
jgi:hypothetical protein